MATNERKRQQQLARKAAKRKQKHQSLQNSAGSNHDGLSELERFETGLAQYLSEETFGGIRPAARQLQQLAAAPVHECLVPAELFRTGIGNVVFSRRLSEGKIAAAYFLLDVYCLGVKDAFVKIMSEGEYQATLRHLGRHATFKKMSPECLRKLVEDAEAYARDLGFEHHRDYEISKLIFGDVDAGACTTRFIFGQAGKPLYVSGPNDSPVRSQQIVDTLHRRCGEGGFHYMVALSESMIDELEEDDAAAFLPVIDADPPRGAKGGMFGLFRKKE